METIQKIRNGFAYFRTSAKRSNTLKEEYYWIVKIDGMQGVAIEIPLDKSVNEQFASISYYTKDYIIGGVEYHLLMLLSNNQNLHNDFAYICASFLEKALDAEEYQGIQKNPISWWHTMKELVGNTNIERATYSVLAELLSYYYFLKHKKEVSWLGQSGASIDFECNDGSYEIKSTIARYGSQVTINSQYQLKANFLMHYRFEPSTNGISIQNVVKGLIGEGIKEQEIESVLKKLDFPVGSEIRTKTYKILEIIKYKIDDNFPKLTLESFKNNKLPEHIIGLTYTVELEGLSGEAINIKEFQ